MPSRHQGWRTARALCAGLSALSLAACFGSGSSSDSPSPPPPATCVVPCVNAGGGTVTGPGGAGVTVPPGALSGNVTLSITANATPPAPVPGQFSAAGAVHAFEPHGQVFAQPVTITVPLDPMAIGTGDTPQLIRSGTGQNAWTPLAGATRNGNVMTVQVTSFSWFVVVKAATAPTISAQPANAAVLVGQTATFSVTAAGTPPLAYQWARNGNAISGATAASYTTPVLALTDNGASFSVTVSNGAGSVTSSAATLTVTAPPPARIDLIGRANYSPQTTFNPWVATDRVALYDATGARRLTPIDADGRFTFTDVRGLTPPLLLVGENGSGGSYGVAAVLREVPDATREVYLSGLSTAVLSAAVGKNALTATSTATVAADTARALTAAQIEAALARARATFGGLATTLGGQAASFDPAISPQSNAIDDIVQSAGSLSNGDTLWINGNAALPATTGVIPVTIGTALPPAAYADAGITKPLQLALDACFRLPVADRVTVDANGSITALKGACASLPVAANYSQNLSSFTARYGDWLRDERLRDAWFGAFMMGAVSDSEAVIGLYYFVRTDAYRFDFLFDTMRRTAPGAATWHLVGNQRKYELFARTEYIRTEQLSPPPATPTSVFGFSRLDAAIGFRFDPTNGTEAASVRALRIRGRGLPAAGIVLTRSSSCNRADRFVIANKTGDTAVTVSGNRGSFFYLQSVPLQSGGPLGPWPSGDPTFADTMLTDAQLSEIGSLEPYQVEVFKQTDTTTPSETLTIRIGNPPQAVARQRSFGWTLLDPATRRYLNPTLPEAAASTSIPMAWSLPNTNFQGQGVAHDPVNVYLVTRGNVDGVTNKRVNDSRSFQPGSRTSVVFAPNRPPAGESNPCTGSAFPQLTTTPGNFRGFGTFHQQNTVGYSNEFYFQTF